MTATIQHGLHPDAESLSAFSEQALSARERADVLAHLAVCARCRHVVALAREAADAGALTAAAQIRKTKVPNAWWRQWRLVWVPTAIVTAFAAASIAVYIERADRHDSEIKIQARNQAQSAQPSTPSSADQAKVEPPATPAPAASPAQTEKHARTAAAEPLPAPRITAGQIPPKPEVVDQVETPRRERPNAPTEVQQAPSEFVGGAGQPASSQPEAGAWEAQKQAEEQRQAEVDKPRMRLFKSKAAPAAVQTVNAAPPAGAMQTVTVAAAPPLDTEPGATKETLAMSAVKPTGPATVPSKPMQLPSGLAAVSIASGGQFLLAIDKAGALFLSEDHGATWERITTQWTGRAVAVRHQTQIHGAFYAAPGAPNKPTDGSSTNAGLSPSPTTIFELSNDKNQTWVSTDGRIWSAK